MIIIVIFFILIILIISGVFGGDIQIEPIPGSEPYLRALSRIPGVANADPPVTLAHVPGELEYARGLYTGRRFGYHNGQRKLFLTEVQFLTEVMMNKSPGVNTRRQINVVYAGAAPGNHDYILAGIFPNIKFILVDPRCFNILISGIPHMLLLNRYIKYLYHNHSDNTFTQITNQYRDKISWLKDWTQKQFYPPVFKASDKDIGKYNMITPEMITRMIEEVQSSEIANIFLIEDYFTDTLARGLAQLPGETYFFSDIRTNTRSEDNINPRAQELDLPGDMDIMYNLAQQYVWVKLLRPRGFMLKFRCLFDYANKKIPPGKPSEFESETFENAKSMGLDILKYAREPTLEYLRGEIRLQPWAPVSSTETRLVAFSNSGDYEMAYYSQSEYENKLNYYNTISRGLTHFRNDYINRKVGFDNCAECAIEAKIWEAFFEYAQSVVGIKINVLVGVNGISASLKRDLFHDEHGKLYTPGSEHVLRLLQEADVHNFKLLSGHNWNYKSPFDPGKIKFVSPINLSPQPDNSYDWDNPGESEIWDSILYRIPDKSFRDTYKSMIMSCMNKTITYDNIPLTLDKLHIPPEYENMVYPSRGIIRCSVSNQTIILISVILSAYIHTGCKTFVTPGFDKAIREDVELVMRVLPGAIIHEFTRPYDITGGDYVKHPGVIPSNLPVPGSDYVYINIIFHGTREFTSVEYFQYINDFINFVKTYKPKYWLGLFNAKESPYSLESRDVTRKAATAAGIPESQSLNMIPRSLGAQILLIPCMFYASSEIFVLGSGDITLKEYDPGMLSRVMYIQNVARSYQYAENPGVNLKIGFDYCLDCAIFYKLVKLAMAKANTPGDIDNVIQSIVSGIKIPISIKPHGFANTPGLTMERLKQLFILTSPAKKIFGVGFR